MYSSHGSGVGIGLIAAKMLADAVAQASGDIGASNTLHGYASAFHKRWGALLGTSDALRRVSQQFAPEDIRYMIASGMMTESMMQSTLMQTPVSPNLTDIPNQLIAALKHTKLSKKLSPLLWRLPLIALAPKSYPSLDPSNRKRLDGYERRMQYCVDRLSLQ
jgi:flavin-dependent dehydrogenase